jgi:hypothetical protein
MAIYCCCVPFIYLFRLIVYLCGACFKHRSFVKEPFREQLMSNRLDGGWYTNYYKKIISTRDVFYILLAQRFINKRDKRVICKFIKRLCNDITADGQVPWKYRTNWHGALVPVYMHNGVKVDDANAQFLIMLWWLVEENKQLAGELYIYALRVWHWIENHIKEDIFYESIGASWETTRVHDGYLLLTNVLTIHCIRCMELISMTRKDKRQQELCVTKHDKFKSRWVAEIYKTQETLPRILAVHWNIVPTSFIDSFNQTLQFQRVPLRTPGPIMDVNTVESRIYGYSDQYTSVVWPWIGFLWIVTCIGKNKQDIARGWWTSYLEFHHGTTLYDMYEPTTNKPVRRAFLKASPHHSVTLATYLAAEHHMTDILV